MLGLIILEYASRVFFQLNFYVFVLNHFYELKLLNLIHVFHIWI